jgi:hypothetical protein
MAQAPDTILAILQRHLNTATAPVDPMGHLATYHPEALLPIGTDLVRREDVTAAEYVQGWETVFAGLGPDGTGPAFTVAEVLAWQPDSSGGRLAVLVHDGRGGAWPTAWLCEGEAPLIRAVCHLDGPLPDRANLIAQACAELVPWGPFHAATIRPLSPLGILWHRLACPEALPLESLPESRFTCQNRGDCCQVRKWMVPVSANADVALDGIPWSELTDSPPLVTETRHEGWQLMPNGAGDCQARSDGGCSVHRVLGRQPMPICQLFPMQATVTPDAIALTATFTCPTVGANLGLPLREQDADFRERLRPWRQDLPTVTDPVRLWPDGPPLAWSTYKVLEAWLLDVLADRRRGDLAARVLAASSGLAALLEAAQSRGQCPDEPLAVLQAGSEAPRRRTAMLADALMGTICGDHAWEPVSVRPFGGWLRSHWSLSRMGTIGSERDDELATRYLRTVLFRKPRLGTGGMAFTWGLVAWLACLWDRQTVYQSRHEQRPIDRDLQLDTARRLDQLILHTSLVQRMEQDADIQRRLGLPETWLAFAAASG